MANTPPSVSVVVPCWNDPAALRSLLTTIVALSGVEETIVADASSTDDCQAIAIAAGARVVACSSANRGRQMNAGARVSCGDVLLFQHADTQLTQAHLIALKQTMEDADIAGGAFHRKFDARHPLLRWLERPARLFAKLGGPMFGDQSVFVRRQVFQRLGGFAEIPLMEDLEFSRRLRKGGRVKVIDPPIRSSARHHQLRGAWRTSIRNALLIALYRAGVPTQKLHAWYYRRPIYEQT